MLARKWDPFSPHAEVVDPLTAEAEAEAGSRGASRRRRSAK